MFRLQLTDTPVPSPTEQTARTTDNSVSNANGATDDDLDSCIQLIDDVDSWIAFSYGQTITIGRVFIYVSSNFANAGK